MKLCFTVDVELDLGNGPSSYGIDKGLPFILSILKEYGIKGTFFINGLSIDRLKETKLIEKIIIDGHEIASHGYRHVDYRELPFDVARKELSYVKEALQSLTGKVVKGFRAPQFRVNDYLLNILCEVGYMYDSSVPEPKCISAASLLRGVKSSSHLLESTCPLEFPITCLSTIPIPHGLLWVSKISFELYKKLFTNLVKRKKQINFYIHPFDIVASDAMGKKFLKGVLRKSFYLFNLESPRKLLENLILFWAETKVKFSTLETFLEGDKND